MNRVLPLPFPPILSLRLHDVAKDFSLFLPRFLEKWGMSAPLPFLPPGRRNRPRLCFFLSRRSCAVAIEVKDALPSFLAWAVETNIQRWVPPFSHALGTRRTGQPSVPPPSFAALPSAGRKNPRRVSLFPFSLLPGVDFPFLFAAAGKTEP